jgi:acetoacetate decarboxylase
MTRTMLPRYVDRGGDLVYPPPYLARGVTNYAFFLQADPASLERTFARLFAEPSGGAIDIRPVGGEVMLSVAQLAEVNSTEPPHSEMSAGGAEVEVAFWVTGRDVQDDRLVLITPYMFVDSGAAMAAGREIFGFPKQEAKIALTGGHPPDAVSLDVLSIRRFDPATTFAVNRVIELERTGTRSDLIAGFGALAKSAVTSLFTHGGRQALLDHLRTVGSLLIGGGLPVVFLKQFRDIAEPDRACYQAICEARIEVTALHGMGVLGDYAITLNDLVSEAIRADLGLAPGPVRPFAATWSRYDFILHRGATLWRAA